VALFEFFLATARAWIIAADIFQCVTHWLLRRVIAMWAVNMIMLVVVMIMIAIRAVDVWLVAHGNYSGMK
jgi:hypothetical protein